MKFWFMFDCIHLVNISEMTKIAFFDPDKTPDINDPNNYCIACEFQLKSRGGYREHLKRTHQAVILHPDKTPDKDNHNFFCCACEIKYSSRSNYTAHLRRVHKMVQRRKGIVNVNAIPDPYDTNNYCNACNACEKSYKHRGKFTKHLEKHQNVNVSLLSREVFTMKKRGIQGK
jgi:hypothetical protein